MDDNLVMFDVETRSLWPQLLGMAVVGPRGGDCLVVERNVTTTTWGAWRRLHPATVVLSNQNEARTGVRPSFYDIDPYEPYHADPGSLHEPTHPDDRLPAKTIVLGVHAEDSDVAVQLDESITHVELGGTPAVLFVDPDSGTWFAFENNLDGVVRRFVGRGPHDAGFPLFTDVETGSVWTIDGIATDGPLAGKRLAQLPAVEVYWFVWSSLFPGTGIR